MTEIEKALLPQAVRAEQEAVQQQNILDTARDAAKDAKMEMFAAYAQLQLEFQMLHLQGWGAMGVRKLEDLVDEFKSACQGYRSAEDAVIVMLSRQSSGLAGPTPSELAGEKKWDWADVPEITDSPEEVAKKLGIDSTTGMPKPE